ncbi:MAG: hypothetical protein KatS3mg109_0222 [Pirellulaceae bacterium]|nr:MAG: hypothetical protein KatS3mg109_0222 [Pirellulaceae bacterium]
MTPCQKRDSQRPVICTTPVGQATNIPPLIDVEQSSIQSPENGYFRAPFRPEQVVLQQPSRLCRGAGNAYSGSGRPLVSGTKGKTISPIRNTAHMTNPAYRRGSGVPRKTPIRCPSRNGPSADTNRPTL